MMMKPLVFLSLLSLAVFAGCSKDKPLKDVDDVCTQMGDNSFAAYCRSNFDTDKDGKVSMLEASWVENIVLRGKGVSSLKGLAYFINLKTLDCSQNNLSTLDVSGNKSLTWLDCSVNTLKTLDLSQNPDLLRLLANDNELETLNLSGNTNLVGFSCRENHLSSLDISTLHWLERSAFILTYSVGFQKGDRVITITDQKDNWGKNAPSAETLNEALKEGKILWTWK